MKSIINRRGSKAVTHAFRRSGAPRRTIPTKTSKSSTAAKPCSSCGNLGWDTMDKVAACNCCENGEFYTPRAETR